MNFAEINENVKTLSNNLVGFAKLERMIAVICCFIPLILAWTDNWNFRDSVSNYVYMNKSYIYGATLTMAAMLFIVNGAIYLKTKNIKKKQERREMV